MAMRFVCRRPAVPCCILAALLAVALLYSGALASYYVDFNASDLTLSPRNGGDAVRLTGCSSMNVTGMPDLPTKGISIAIPSNMDATGVRIVNAEYIDLPGTYRIAPCVPPLTAGTVAATKTMSAQSASAVDFPRGIYPGELVRFGRCGWLSSHHLAGITVCPVQYDTLTGALRLYTHIEFELIMSPCNSNAPAIAVRSTAGQKAFASMAKSFVINPSEIRPTPTQWAAAKAMVGDAEYLIITDASFVDSFQALADWKKAKGYTTAIVTTDSIYNTYSGFDNPAKIRARIQEYVNTHGTAWVLLGGDSDFVPVRKTGCTDPPASDLYYSDLTGDWNADNVAGAETVYPTDAPTSFALGSTYTGTSYPNCDASSDNGYHQIGTETVYNIIQQPEFYYVTTTTIADPTALTLTFEGRKSAGASFNLLLYNYISRTWENVKSANLGTVEEIWTIPISGDASVSSNRARVICSVRSSTPPQG